MRTFYIYTIDHDKPLPDEAAELISNRIYTLLLSHGVKVDVNVNELPVMEFGDER